MCPAVFVDVVLVLLVAPMGWPSRSFDLEDRRGATPAPIPSPSQQRLDLSCQDGRSSVADIAVEVEQTT